MSHTPPPVRDAELVAVDTSDEKEIERRLNPFVRLLHAYLNQLPCLHDLQKIRRRWKARTAEKEAFGNFVAHAGEFYTYHHGGRKEAHFNISLRGTYFTIGLGFEFTLKKGGDPTAVQLAYACFTNLIRAKQTDFERFVTEQQLEIEWSDTARQSLDIVPTNEVVPWLLNPPQEPRWIMVGRILRRGQDTTVLENPDALGSVMQAVLCGFRPIWERTQVMAHS